MSVTWTAVVSPWIAVGVEQLPFPYVVTLRDRNNDTLTIYVAYKEVYDKLVELYETRKQMWVAGIVIPYVYNEWGFNFDPYTIGVAEFTIEVCQTTIRLIKQDLNYWLGNQACIWSSIIDVKELPHP